MIDLVERLGGRTVHFYHRLRKRKLHIRECNCEGWKPYGTW